MELLQVTEVISNAAPEHFVKDSLVVELNDHDFDFFECGHLDIDSDHDFIEVIGCILGGFHDSALVLSLDDAAPKRWDLALVHDAGTLHILSKKELVDVHFLLEVVAHSLETVFPDV